MHTVQLGVACMYFRSLSSVCIVEPVWLAAAAFCFLAGVVKARGCMEQVQITQQKSESVGRITFAPKRAHFFLSGSHVAETHSF